MKNNVMVVLSGLMVIWGMQRCNLWLCGPFPLEAWRCVHPYSLASIIKALISGIPLRLDETFGV